MRNDLVWFKRTVYSYKQQNEYTESDVEGKEIWKLFVIANYKVHQLFTKSIKLKSRTQKSCFQ